MSERGCRSGKHHKHTGLWNVSGDTGEGSTTSDDNGTNESSVEPKTEDIKYRQLDDVRGFVDSELSNGCEIEHAKKTASVTAHVGTEGEVIVTSQDGTTNVVGIHDGLLDYVVQNAGDASPYVVHAKDFNAKYSHADGDVYQSNAAPVNVLKLRQDVRFSAPWGEEMSVKAGGYLVIGEGNDIYGIDPDSFKNTYEILDGD